MPGFAGAAPPSTKLKRRDWFVGLHMIGKVHLSRELLILLPFLRMNMVSFLISLLQRQGKDRLYNVRALWVLIINIHTVRPSPSRECVGILGG